MGFSLSDLAYAGAGFTKQEGVNRKRKDAQRQSLMHYVQLMQAEKGREENASSLKAYRDAEAKRHGDEFDRRMKDAEDQHKQNGELKAEGLTLKQALAGEKTTNDGLRQQVSGFNAYRGILPRIGDMTHAQQEDAIRQINRSGTQITVPGEVDGARPLNFGMPESAAGPVRQTLAQMLGAPEAMLSTPTHAPYYQPTPDQAGKRGQVAAATAGTVARTAMVAPNARERHRHNVENEHLGISGFGERSRHDRAGEELGQGSLAERGRHDLVVEGQGNSRISQGAQRIGQGSERISLSQARGGKAGADPVEVIQRRLTEMSKPGKYNILTNKNEPSPKDTPEGKQEYAHLVNQRKRLLSPIAPGSTPGYSLRSFPRGANPPPLASLGPLPGTGRPTLRQALPPAHHSSEAHHSHGQPRHPKSGQFRPGTLRSRKSSDLMKSLGI
jgi:hypothetical protein